MFGILSTAHGFIVRARSSALDIGDTGGLPEIPVPTRVVVKYGVADPHGLILHLARQLPHERHADVILPVDSLRLGQWFADHFGKLPHAGTVDLCEVHGFSHVATESGHLG